MIGFLETPSHLAVVTSLAGCDWFFEGSSPPKKKQKKLTNCPGVLTRIFKSWRKLVNLLTGNESALSWRRVEYIIYEYF